MRLGKPGDAVSTSGSVMRQIINEQLQISESNPIKARYYDYDRFTYPWHFHSQYEIIYVKKSCGRCFVGDCIERFSEGDVVLFGPSLPHYMRRTMLITAIIPGCGCKELSFSLRRTSCNTRSTIIRSFTRYGCC